MVPVACPFVIRRKPEAAIYQQIAAKLRSRIVDGEFVAGKPLGSEKALAFEYGVSPATISAAVEVLRLEGLIEPAIPGRLAMVRERPPIREVIGRRGSVVYGRPATVEDVDRAAASGAGGIVVGTPVFVVEFGVETFIYPQDRLTLRFN